MARRDLPVPERSRCQPTIQSRTYQVRLATPLFGGGVRLQPKGREHLKLHDRVTPVRSAAARGHLRFWWRALANYMTLEELHQNEMRVWGGSTTRDESRAGLVAIRIRRVIGELADSPDPKAFSGLAYGAFPLRPGQGADPRIGKLREPPNGGTFGYTLVVTASGLQPGEWEHVQQSVAAWIMFGGIGGRTRRGFGALVSDSISHNEWQAILSLLNEPMPGTVRLGVPSLRGARLVRSNRDPGTTAAQSLERGLAALQAFRHKAAEHDGGLGARDPRSGNRPGESRWPEADAIRKLSGCAAPYRLPPSNPPQVFPRSIFGLPIIFQFKDHDGRRPGTNTDPAQHTLVPRGGSRLASPVIVRPMKVGEAWRPAVLFLATDAEAVIGKLVLKKGDTAHDVRGHIEEPDFRGDSRLRMVRVDADGVLASFARFFQEFCP